MKIPILASYQSLELPRLLMALTLLGYHDDRGTSGFRKPKGIWP